MRVRRNDEEGGLLAFGWATPQMDGFQQPAKILFLRILE
jgi:hypothetical protein